MLIKIVVGVLAWILGVFGFAQIIGSLQNVWRRGIGATLFTIILWCAILFGGWFLMGKFAPQASTAFYIGYGIAFVQILFSGRIQ